uniref:Uncharacterized protein n=1 Tax=Triticum urartu TaxID=4572 RepID=A0A8R7P9D9_TRIUA
MWPSITKEELVQRAIGHELIYKQSVSSLIAETKQPDQVLVKCLPDGLHFHHELLLSLLLELSNFLDGDAGRMLILQPSFVHSTRGTAAKHLMETTGCLLQFIVSKNLWGQYRTT